MGLVLIHGIKMNQQINKTLVVNLFGGAGIGKSTLAAGLFYNLKCDGYEVELVTEYAKELTWQQHMGVLSNQLYVTAKQLNRVHRLLGKVDVIITDSPIILGIIYGGFGATPSFRPCIVEIFNEFSNINFLLERTVDYNPNGRNQNKEAAIAVDNRIETLLVEETIDFIRLPVDSDTISFMSGVIESKL